MEQNEQSVPWSFKRMCTKKCEQENMAKGREKNFFLLNFFSKKKKARNCVNAEKIPSFFFFKCPFFPFFFFEKKEPRPLCGAERFARKSV